MEDARFPRNGREGFLYGGTIAAITAYLMALLNMSRSLGGFRTEYLVEILPTFVVVWIVVMLLMSLIVGRVSDMSSQNIWHLMTAPTAGSSSA